MPVRSATALPRRYFPFFFFLHFFLAAAACFLCFFFLHFFLPGWPVDGVGAEGVRVAARFSRKPPPLASCWVSPWPAVGVEGVSSAIRPSVNGVVPSLK